MKFLHIKYMKESQSKRFCMCIKKVAKTLKGRSSAAKEKGAIAICVKSVLQSRGRTLKRFSCKKKKGPNVQTQALKK